MERFEFSYLPDDEASGYVMCLRLWPDSDNADGVAWAALRDAIALVTGDRKHAASLALLRRGSVPTQMSAVPVQLPFLKGWFVAVEARSIGIPSEL